MYKEKMYTAPNGATVREVHIDAGLKKEVIIGHISDVHLNYCNAQDFAQADPVIMSTYENRKWCANGETVPKLRNCTEALGKTDKTVFNGDTLDYISHGTMELMQNEVWDKFPGVIATVGGHELSRKMQGTVEDNLSRDERIQIIKDYWKHDIYYVSELLCDKVLIIGMLNDLATYTQQQYEKLAADLQYARDNGYIVLIFAHEPMITMNEKYAKVTAEDAITVGDDSVFPCDFYYGTENGDILVGSHKCDDTTKAVYEIIVNSADVVKGIFAGHYHNDMYLEISASTPDGDSRIIPEYIHTASAYDNGHVMKIILR